ncbi:MAG: type I methionyl aminopeptidase [Ignavibacteriaceae bacterium]|nr:type I methionyl aminopeptidase [Ignavibacterium sp.]MCC6253834.1 type I methionyl aminopeptidase [Ignavibacteriaceae bacterium]HRN25378.1 type I methionyl aminopeptidase [Ignavibacteriaceae bacterium]HRP93549.1 type I methionyl aminopeptidase [Ignavibacteriaceae bacterium]HRQ53020.1 type I methionyl aminopeptidase [Ignavibacteriaceae bacterium]
MILIKSKKEIDYIRESCRIVAETLQLLKSNVRVGITTLELDKIAEDYIRSNNAKPAFKGYSQGGAPGFPGSICSSVDEEVVHGIPSSRILKDGEIVSLDIGVLKDGYFGDAALSVAVGSLSDEKKKLMEVTERSLQLGIEQAVAGNKVHDISNAVQVYVEANGFSIVRDLCGHGVGKFLHEDPAIPNFGRKGTGAKLKNGMTLAIEPMVNAGKYDVVTARDGWTIITADGSASAHFEHTILINNNSPEILTVC